MNVYEAHQEKRLEALRRWCVAHNYADDSGGLDQSHVEAFLAGYDAAGAWDDAIHVAAPWQQHSSLCGNWNRNLVPIDGERPDGVSGCWTCLMAAEWFDKYGREGVNVRAVAEAARKVIRFDRGRLSGHGWEELVAAYDAWWQEQEHPLDESEGGAA